MSCVQNFRPVLDPEDPALNAQQFLAQNPDLKSKIFNSRIFHEPCAYDLFDDSEDAREYVAARILLFLDSSRKRKEDGSLVRFAPRKRHVDDVIYVLTALTTLRRNDGRESRV